MATIQNSHANEFLSKIKYQIYQINVKPTNPTNKELAIALDTRIRFHAFLLHGCFLHHLNLDLKTIEKTWVSRKGMHTCRWRSLPKTPTTNSSLVHTSSPFCFRVHFLFWCLKLFMAWDHAGRGLLEGLEPLRIWRVDNVKDSLSLWLFN